jgi:hypothetical protein
LLISAARGQVDSVGDDLLLTTEEIQNDFRAWVKLWEQEVQRWKELEDQTMTITE